MTSYYSQHTSHRLSVATLLRILEKGAVCMGRSRGSLDSLFDITADCFQG